MDEFAQGLTVAQALQGPGHQGQVDVPPRLIPRSKGPRGDVFLHPLCGASQPRVFPIVDGPSSVGGQVLNETTLHQAREQGHRPITNQVGPIHQDHRCSRFPGRADGFHHLAHRVGLSRRQGSRGAIGGNENVLHPSQTASFLQRSNLQAQQINRPHSSSHWKTRLPQKKARNSRVEPNPTSCSDER